MAGKEEKVEQTPERPEGEALEAQTKTYTHTQEEFDTAIAQTKEEELRKYQGIQRTIAKKDERIKQLEEQAPPSLKGSEILLDEMRARQTEYGEPNPRIALLEAQITKERQEEARQKYVQWQQREIKKHREAFDQRIKKAGLDPTDERLEDYLDAFEDAEDTGNFGRAERKLDRILGKVSPTKETDKPTEDEDEERALKLLKAKGYNLETDDGGPSGGGGKLTAEQVRKMSPDERAARSEEIARMPLGLGLK